MTNMCIECIITWVAIPVGVAVGLYYWIVKKCIVYHKNMCESYTTIEESYTNMVTQLRGMKEVYAKTNKRMDHIDLWSKQFSETITTTLNKQDSNIARHESILDKLKGTKKNEPSN